MLRKEVSNEPLILNTDNGTVKPTALAFNVFCLSQIGSVLWSFKKRSTLTFGYFGILWYTFMCLNVDPAIVNKW